MEGWIKLHRKFDEWQWINKPEMVSIFIYCIIKANHNGNFWMDTEIKRGQFVTSPEKISIKLGISYQTVRTCLTRLEKTGEINKQTTNKYTIITICNYDSYQIDQQSTNKRTNKQLTNNQQTTNNKQEYKEIKNDKNIYSENQNIFLKEDEYEKLKKDFPDLYDKAIQFLSNYKIEKNYKTKSDYLTIRRWVIDAVKSKQPQVKKDIFTLYRENKQINAQ